MGLNLALRDDLLDARGDLRPDVRCRLLKYRRVLGVAEGLGRVRGRGEHVPRVRDERGPRRAGPDVDADVVFFSGHWGSFGEENSEPLVLLFNGMEGRMLGFAGGAWIRRGAGGAEEARERTHC